MASKTVTRSIAGAIDTSDGELYMSMRITWTHGFLTWAFKSYIGYGQALYIERLLQWNCHNRGHLDKVDHSGYRKIILI